MSDNNSLGFEGKYQGPKGETLDVSLDLITFEDDGATIVYAPALDVYGYGDNEEEAKESFRICLEEFFRYTLNKNTLHKELKRLGWTVKSKQKIKNPPTFNELLNKNEALRDIVNNNPNINKYKEDIAIPA